MGRNGVGVHAVLNCSVPMILLGVHDGGDRGSGPSDDEESSDEQVPEIGHGS